MSVGSFCLGTQADDTERCRGRGAAGMLFRTDGIQSPEATEDACLETSYRMKQSVHPTRAAIVLFGLIFPSPQNETVKSTQ